MAVKHCKQICNHRTKVNLNEVLNLIVFTSIIVEVHIMMTAQ